MRIRRIAAAIACVALAGPCLAAADGLERAIGKALFDRMWVQAPSSTLANDGLGPLFNEKSCASCHSGKALSAWIVAAPDGTLQSRGVTTRLGDAAGNSDPLYGRQIQPRAVAGLEGEGSVAYRLSGKPGDRVIADWTPSRGAASPATHLGPRQAPSLRGIGAIGRVDAAAVLALADPDDRDGDGISGRPRVIDVGGKPELGRFGWKASAATLDQQVADAFMLDIGMSSPLSPHPSGDCTAAEPDCLASPNGRSPTFDNEEISGQMIGLVSAYLDGLAPPPAPSPLPPGAALFASVGCSACHVQSLPASGGGTVTIYSDLLLHDMGPALDDGVGEPGVASSEWRTAPLMSLSSRREAVRRYLHDGRAATLDDAIRAHGGEAGRAQSNYSSLPAADRAALIAYLETL